MQGGREAPIRVALVDVEAAGLDLWRDALAAAGGATSRASAEVRLVIADSTADLAWRWGALAHTPCAGEVAALGEQVTDAVVIGAHSPRADAAAHLAAALGARVVRLPEPA